VRLQHTSMDATAVAFMVSRVPTRSPKTRSLLTLLARLSG
jgi:hypothetical protein